MTKLYLVGHGGADDGTTTFVPPGRVVHSYAEDGATLSGIAVDVILSAGGNETGLRVIKPGKTMFNWGLVRLQSDELQRDLTVASSAMDGRVHFVKKALRLCTKPRSCGPIYWKWHEEAYAKSGRQGGSLGPPEHHPDCAGVFNRFPDYTEIHLLVCQVLSGDQRKPVRTQEGVPRFARNADGSVRIGADGQPLVEIDMTEIERLDARVEEIMRRAEADPVDALMYLHNVVKDDELAKLRSASDKFDEWLEESWDYYQKMAPWNFKHNADEAESKYAQYYLDEPDDGWLDNTFRKQLEGSSIPSSFVDCMQYATMSEAFFKWFFTDFTKKSGNHTYEWTYFLWDLTAVRWRADEVTAEEVIEKCGTHNLSTMLPDFSAVLVDLVDALVRKMDNNADDVTRVDGEKSVEECMDAITQMTEGHLEQVYLNGFVPALLAEFSS